MAELTSEQRRKVNAAVMRSFSAYEEQVPILKTDLRAAVDALDTYLNTNASAINQAIPQPARAALSTGQKAVIFTAVQIARYMIDNPTAIDELAHLLGQVREEVG